MSEYFNGEYFFNVALHVTFLFLFLSAFFIGYVKTLTSNAINHEINGIINNAFSNLDNKNKIKTIIKKIKKMYYKIDNVQTLNILQSLLNSGSIKDPLMIDALKLVLSTLHANNNLNSSNSNILNYYATLFSKDNQAREIYNNNLINGIIHIDILLVVILFLFMIILIKLKSIRFGEIGYVILENFLTFFFVGIVEYLFFTSIAIKYIPSLPSNIYTEIISNLQSNFNTI
jgi:hypothetical protein